MGVSVTNMVLHAWSRAMPHASRLWGEKKGGKGKRGAGIEAAMDAYGELLDKIGAVNEATEDAFAYGADVRVLDPAAGRGAEAAQQEAAEAALVRALLCMHACMMLPDSNSPARRTALHTSAHHGAHAWSRPTFACVQQPFACVQQQDRGNMSEK